METLHNLEQKMAEWYKPMPRLPRDAQKWLAENIWWIVLVGVVCGAIALVSVFFFTLLAGTLLTAFGGGFGALLGVLIFMSVLTSVIAGGIGLVLGGLAIMPLQEMRRKGWTLLFMTLLIQAASIILSNVLSMNLPMLIWGLLWVAVGGYFLFEIRSYFVSITKTKKIKRGQKA